MASNLRSLRFGPARCLDEPARLDLEAALAVSARAAHGVGLTVFHCLEHHDAALDLELVHEALAPSPDGLEGSRPAASREKHGQILHDVVAPCFDAEDDDEVV